MLGRSIDDGNYDKDEEKSGAPQMMFSLDVYFFEVQVYSVRHKVINIDSQDRTKNKKNTEMNHKNVF